jgi:hypothetical protein
MLLNTKNKPDNFETVSEMVFNILYKLPGVITGDKFKNITSSKDLALNNLNTIEELEAQ